MFRMNTKEIEGALVTIFGPPSSIDRYYSYDPTGVYSYGDPADPDFQVRFTCADSKTYFADALYTIDYLKKDCPALSFSGSSVFAVSIQLCAQIFKKTPDEGTSNE